MSKRLLIAIDASPVSDAALTEAIALAHLEDADLHLVHVVDETAVAWGERDSSRRSRLRALACKGVGLLDRAEARGRAAGCRTSRACLRRDRYTDSLGGLIAAEADAWGADLVVVGSHGYGPIRRVLHSSVELAVRRSSKVPVIAVRANAEVPGGSGHLPPAAPSRLGLA